MATERAVCTIADCHHDLSGSALPPHFCPACSASVITLCPNWKRALAETKDPWANPWWGMWREATLSHQPNLLWSDVITHAVPSMVISWVILLCAPRLRVPCASCWGAETLEPLWRVRI